METTIPKAPAKTIAEMHQRFLEPFDPRDLEWRAGASTEKDDKVRALALAYTTARGVMTRLDEVAGFGSWWAEYLPVPGNEKGALLCRLRIRNPETKEWMIFEGIGQGDDPKAAESDSLKRACVKAGIGRYLYYLPDVWSKAIKRGKMVHLEERPALPSWAFPSDVPENAKEVFGTSILIPRYAWGDEAPTGSGLNIHRSDDAPRTNVDDLKKQADGAGKVSAPKTEKPVASSKVEAPKVAEDAQKELMDEKLERAMTYVIPANTRLPGAGKKTLAQAYGESAKMGLRVLLILAGRTVKGVEPYKPETDDEKKAVSAAKYYLEYLEKTEKDAQAKENPEA